MQKMRTKVSEVSLGCHFLLPKLLGFVDGFALVFRNDSHNTELCILQIMNSYLTWGGIVLYYAEVSFVKIHGL